MKKLLSLPPNLVESFHDITGFSHQEFFCSNDPVGRKLGSGGGSTWLLEQCFRSEKVRGSMTDWLQREKRLLLHAGGQSRRLPAYAPSGKILTPLPVFRWDRGQHLAQHLLSLQLPLYEQIMAAAPDRLNTMIVSGDVYIRATKPLGPIPDVDVVCYGLPLSAEKASHHGVFVSSKEHPEELLYMLQKPKVELFQQLQQTHQCLVDIGIWMLSAKAVELLIHRSKPTNEVSFYDLYTDFGGALGQEPRQIDTEINALKVAILPLPRGEFYHFGTSQEVISSMLTVQNADPHLKKTHRSVFIQSADVEVPLTASHTNIWIENAHVPHTWHLERNHLITGVPRNDWPIHLNEGQCVDIVPIGEKEFAVRPYGINDAFRGSLSATDTQYLGVGVGEWLAQHGLTADVIEGNSDMQSARLFPVVSSIEEAGLVLRWMLGETQLTAGQQLWQQTRKLSADELSTYAHLPRLLTQRREFLTMNLPRMAENHRENMFYQLDLHRMVGLFADNQVPVPAPLAEDEPLMKRISAAMFRSELIERNGLDGRKEYDQAFSLLRKGLAGSSLQEKQQPRLKADWQQGAHKALPVRIDIAGGWTDTPPYSLIEGGRVVNIALSLNNSLPIEVTITPSSDAAIHLHSIDLNAEETIHTFDELSHYNVVGSPFSIPKAALALAGFLPQFSVANYPSLKEQLAVLGTGFTLTMRSAVPAGSGMGTSSILAACVLDVLNDFFSLKWSRTEVGHRTLVLEQLLTTGGGWQDQYGGLLPGVKLLETESGFDQHPQVSQLPTAIFTHPDYAPLHLLYFTGIQRTAKTILAEIVHRMFLNEQQQLHLLRRMKQHASDMAAAIRNGNYEQTGLLVRRTWEQNQRLDAGTNPPQVARLCALVDDLCYGYKSPGAGGGGFLYMLAKDQEAAKRIKQLLKDYALNNQAGFYDMKLWEGDA